MRNRLSSRSKRAAARSSAALGVALVGGILALPTAAAASPAPAPASPLPATVAASECAPATAELSWGVKESFRSYISGSIANGEWTVSDDMRYETPSFIWSQAAGGFASDLSSGTIDFTGAVHFTGHDGAMQLDIANPSLEFAGDDTAYLLLSVGSTDQADAGGEVAAEQVRAAKVDLTGAVDAGGADLAISEAPTRLTAEGAEAFNGEYGSYIAGEEIDPITLTATVSGCELGASAADPEAGESEEPAAEEEQLLIQDAPAEDAGIPWVPIIIGGVAILVIGVTGGMLLAGRKRPDTTNQDAGAGTAAGADTPDAGSGGGES